MSRKENSYKPKQTPDHCLKYICTENLQCKTTFCQFQAVSPAAYGQTEPITKPARDYKCDAFVYKGADKRLYERP